MASAGNLSSADQSACRGTQGLPDAVSGVFRRQDHHDGNLPGPRTRPKLRLDIQCDGQAGRKGIIGEDLPGQARRPTGRHRGQDGVIPGGVQLEPGAADGGGETLEVGRECRGQARDVEGRRLVQPLDEIIGPIIGRGRRAEARHEAEVLGPMVGEFWCELGWQREGLVLPACRDRPADTRPGGHSVRLPGRSSLASEGPAEEHEQGDAVRGAVHARQGPSIGRSHRVSQS